MVLLDDDHSLFCGGCGFPNTSSVPCEVCGTDPETGEIDRDFLAEQRADRDG